VLDEREMAYTELTAYAHEPSHGDDASAVTPFDVESDGESQPTAPMPATAEPSAPFDLERELDSARAA
jgi:hypothetical protein